MKNIPSPRIPDNKRAWREHARLIWAITAKDLLEVVKNKSTISVLISALFILGMYRMLPTLTTRMEPPGVLVYDAGDSALVAAGTIHTDFIRGFIRAEVVSYKDYVTHGGMKGAKEKGLYRLEGREYVVQEADIILFRVAT